MGGPENGDFLECVIEFVEVITMDLNFKGFRQA